MSSILLDSLTPHTLAEQIADTWMSWDSGRQKWKDRYAELKEYIYATSTAETTNSNNPYGHTTHVPKLTQIHDNLGANYADALFRGRNWFAYDPANEADNDAQKRRKIHAYISTKHRLSKFKQQMKLALQDWVQCGNAFGEVSYTIAQSKDPKTKTPRVSYQGPVFKRINPLDIVFDYTAESFEKSPKIIRSLMNIADLLIQAEEDPASANWDRSVIESVKQIRSVVNQLGPTDTQKEIQRQYDGFTNAYNYFTSGTVEVLTFYGDIYDNLTQELHRNRRIMVVDRRYVLVNEDIQSLDGKPYIVHSGWRKRSDNLWAQGPLDNLVGMQYMIDYWENAKSDAFDKILQPDRVIVGNVEVERNGPVTNYWIDDAQGSVQNLAPDVNALNADNQIAIKEAQMEAFAGAPREAMGIRSPGEKTKFEVAQLLNAAGRMFQTKLDQFEEEFIEPVLNFELELAWLHLSGSDVAMTFNDDMAVEDFLTITADDLSGSGRLSGRGAQHYAEQAVLVQEMSNFQNILQGDGELAIHFPAKRRAEVYAGALGLDRYGMYVPFGGIAEAAEREQAIAAAQSGADTGVAAVGALTPQE